MITITDKTKCCGCSACFNICPKQAVSMEYDGEGFLYPKVDNAKCIKCGLCLKVCPTMTAEDLKNRGLEDWKKQTANTNKVLEVYGAKNKNVDEQLKSSSGGMFSIFANFVLEQNGIVFGASFDSNWKVVHKYIDKKENLDDLRRSKYVQSDINITYKQAKQFLDDNKLVLFTGTPCQIAGLKSFLQKDYDNLIAIDIICHGVPSPKVWGKFLKENFNLKQKKINTIADTYFDSYTQIKWINFRNKKFGWDTYFDSYTQIKWINFRNKKFGWDTFFDSYTQKFIELIKIKKIRNMLISYYLHSYFLKGFLANLFLRPSCHKCVFKDNVKSDFTLGDLWGINKILPRMYDNKGVSVLTINSQKAKEIFEKVKNNIEYEKINYDDMVKYNPAFVSSVKPHPNREEFFKRFVTTRDGCVDELRYGNYKNETLNKLIPKLLNEKPLVIKFFRKLLKKIFTLVILLLPIF